MRCCSQFGLGKLVEALQCGQLDGDVFADHLGRHTGVAQPQGQGVRQRQFAQGSFPGTELIGHLSTVHPPRQHPVSTALLTGGPGGTSWRTTRSGSLILRGRYTPRVIRLRKKQHYGVSSPRAPYGLSAGWHVLRICVLSVKELSSHFNSSTALYSQTTSGATPASRYLDAIDYGNGSLRSAHSRALSSLAIRQVCARRACVSEWATTRS